VKGKKIIVCCAILIWLLLICGCGGGSGGSTSITHPAESVARPNIQTITVYFILGEEITPVQRKVESASAKEALLALLEGPNSEEKDRGFTTSIPEGTSLLSYKVGNGVATADFSREILSYGGGSARVQAILGQIEKTILANEKNAEKVEVLVNKVPADEALQP